MNHLISNQTFLILNVYNVFHKSKDNYVNVYFRK